MSEQITFILVDDDAINNMLSEIIISDEFPEATIISFVNPFEGITYFTSDFLDSTSHKTFLFLDINMPIISGWEFLEKLEQNGFKKADSLFVYMLSSSVNPDDVKKAKKNKYITGFMEKPLTEDFLKKLLEKYSLK